MAVVRVRCVKCGEVFRGMLTPMCPGCAKISDDEYLLNRIAMELLDKVTRKLAE